MRVSFWSLLVLALMVRIADAEIRFTGTVHGTARSYEHSPGSEESHSGLGPGVGVDFLWLHPPSGMAYGVHIGWTTWDEDQNNMDAHGRYQLLQLHGWFEKRFSRGAIGVGFGIDQVNLRAYDVTGSYSYTNRHGMTGLDLQLVLDLAKTRSGTLGLVVGFAVFPLIDLDKLFSDGESELGWRGITGSLGLSFAL